MAKTDPWYVRPNDEEPPIHAVMASIAHNKVAERIANLFTPLLGEGNLFIMPLISLQ